MTTSKSKLKPCSVSCNSTLSIIHEMCNPVICSIKNTKEICSYYPMHRSSRQIQINQSIVKPGVNFENAPNKQNQLICQVQHPPFSPMDKNYKIWHDKLLISHKYLFVVPTTIFDRSIRNIHRFVDHFFIWNWLPPTFGSPTRTPTLWHCRSW